jgi:hypothetical protein
MTLSLSFVHLRVGQRVLEALAENTNSDLVI